MTFGERIHCAVSCGRFFLDERDAQRVRVVAETIAALGERLVEAALKSPQLLAQFGLRPEEERLVAIEPGYSRPARLRVWMLFCFLIRFSLPSTTRNRLPGLVIRKRSAKYFAEMPVMARFRRDFSSARHIR